MWLIQICHSIVIIITCRHVPRYVCPLQWFPGSGGSCREQLQICDYFQPTQPQNNWVFTQFISFDEATEIYVNASYQYSACISNARRGCNTLQTTLYRYERNGRNNAKRVNPVEYVQNEVLVLSLTSDQNSKIRTASFRPSASANGFYLGLLDTGTCGSVVRITAYYRVIPSQTDELIYYPEIPLSPVGSSNRSTRFATCAADSTGSNLELTPTQTGLWKATLPVSVTPDTNLNLKIWQVLQQLNALVCSLPHVYYTLSD